MKILIEAGQALWQVALAGLVLGAGLPALFALGLRSLSAGRTVTADGEVVGRTNAAGKAGAAVCFGIVFAAALFGIVLIVYGKQLFGK